MAKCIKTGASVYFENYGYTRNADIYQIDDVVIVVSAAPQKGESEDFCTFARVNATHDLKMPDSIGVYTRDNNTVVVCRATSLKARSMEERNAQTV